MSDQSSFLIPNSPQNRGLVSDEEIYSVSDLTSSIQFILEEEFPGIWVNGEISNYRTPTSGHAYFVLKDQKSQIRCVLFYRQKRLIKFEPEDGQEVLLKGRLSVYGPRGEYQIIVDHLEPRGTGALQLAFEQLKEKLLKQGLFDKDKKKPLPGFPERIGVVTSPTGAAIRDIINVIQRRFPCVNIVIYPVRVQGEGSAAEIANAIDSFNSPDDSQGPIDVMIVGRGGGSIEDLQAFNEEIVARAIFRSKIPVISGIGHEIDFTVSDFVADFRAPTPSAAAEMAVRDKQELLHDINSTCQRLENSLTKKITFLRETIRNIANRRVLTDPFAAIRLRQQKIDEIQLRINRGTLTLYRRFSETREHLSKRLIAQNPKNRIERCRQILLELKKGLIGVSASQTLLAEKKLGILSGRLNALSPLAVLERGYSICRKFPEMKPLKETFDISKGDEVKVSLFKGDIVCEVKEVKNR